MLALQAAEQVDDLRADTDIESGDGLVEDEKRGRRARARAILMRWRWPPENSWG